ncbi:MAG TPA: hypothetical protein VK425_03090 [Acidimicrobiales bacterium]|nr:hypothetical protein [Acidimicrobiales bacterium]
MAPSKGLVDGSVVTIRISGGSYGTTYAVADCDPTALVLLAEGSSSLQDACDSRHNTMLTLDEQGGAQATLSLPALLTTSLGKADCRHAQCFLAAVPVNPPSTVPLPLVVQLSFARDACAAPGSCQLPADAWDPSLGALARPSAPPGPTGQPSVLALRPLLAGDLTAQGSVTGPYSGQPLALTSTATTSAGAQGEGLLRLALEAPGTTWGPGTPCSTVVDASVRDLTTGALIGTQQFVLFYGSAPFVYAGFVGPVRGSDRYSVTLSIEPPASDGGLSEPAGSPVVVLASALEVVAATNPQYLAYAYAPVMYGRSTSALHDVPLLQYATVSPVGAGGHLLTYVVVWSHEDGGTGFYPFLEWGMWGRLTDIEDAISFVVASNGQVSGAKYLWGGEPLRGFPDSQTALVEKYQAFAGAWWGHHPVLRDATGNNDFSDLGTTRFRFQLAPVAAPAPGLPRDAVMDVNPFTYQVMAEEAARWYADTSTAPTSPQEGDARQYALVGLDTTGKGVSSVSVDLQLAGYSGWFRSDLGWGYPLVGTGQVRTVVKLPLDWASHAITAARVAVEPGSAAPGVVVHSLGVERFTGSSVVTVPAPAPAVVPEVLAVAPGQ